MSDGRLRFASEKLLIEVGRRLGWLREAFGHSQKQWAEALGVTPQVVSKWESGQRQPNLDVLFAIITETGASWDYLMAGRLSAEMNPELRRYLLLHHREYLSVLEWTTAPDRGKFVVQQERDPRTKQTARRMAAL